MNQDRPREVRLGIVMYGGVSLAVYENGVAQELFRAMKGEGVYRWVKALIDSDIVVDIISGTSAGGINGILLGYALANNKDFRSSATLWREDGDILKLLRRPSDPGTLSILDSRGYYQDRLEAAFHGMPPYPVSANAEVSNVDELDLFVTGTDVHGKIFTAFDDAGNPIDVKEHKQVFVLSYREGRKNEFAPEGYSALAKLARVTSCFPIAFEPVHVPDPKDQRDDLLQRWGQISHDAFYLDGGVLDNKPFSYAIDAIFRRTADREVSRMLMYVEPDPERFTDIPLDCAPNIMQAATGALISIPGYQSIGSDLKAIAAHNDCVQRYKEICGCVPTIPASSRANCFEDMESPLTLLDSDEHRKGIYLAARFSRVRDRVVEGLLNDHKGRGIFSGADRHAAKILVQSFETFQSDIGRVLDVFDVYYRLRRAFHLTYFIADRITRLGETEPESTTIKGYRNLWSRINHQIKILEMTQFAMESAIDAAPIAWHHLRDQPASSSNAAGIWANVQNVVLSILDTAQIPSLDGSLQNAADTTGEGPAELQKRQRIEFMRVLRERIRNASTNDGTKDAQVSGTLLQLTDNLERELLKRFAPLGPEDPVCQEYCRFIILDSYVYPMLRMADLQSTDVIKTVRISPIDAKLGYSAKAIEEKLCGIQLGHFGAFLKASWRANDIMWGRLDGVCQIIQCLVTPERLQRLCRNSPGVPAAQELGTVFPHSSTEELTLLLEQAGEAINASGAGDGGPSEVFLDSLVRAAQREILHEELPHVIDTAIRQQAYWNQFDIQSDPKVPLLDKRQRWVTGVEQLDSAVTSYAASRLAKDVKADNGEWPSFFEQQYQVGREKWNTSIPRPVLLEILATTALVLRNCLVAVAGERAGKIRSSPIYQLGLNLPLLFTYHFVSLQRRAPEYVSIFMTFIMTVLVVILAIDFIQFRRLFVENNAWQWHAMFFWMALPAGALFFIVLLLVWSKHTAR
jgi:patatin-related protein